MVARGAAARAEASRAPPLCLIQGRGGTTPSGAHGRSARRAPAAASRGEGGQPPCSGRRGAGARRRRRREEVQRGKKRVRACVFCFTLEVSTDSGPTVNCSSSVGSAGLSLRAGAIAGGGVGEGGRRRGRRTEQRRAGTRRGSPHSLAPPRPARPRRGQGAAPGRRCPCGGRWFSLGGKASWLSHEVMFVPRGADEARSGPAGLAQLIFLCAVPGRKKRSSADRRGRGAAAGMSAPPPPPLVGGGAGERQACEPAGGSDVALVIAVDRGAGDAGPGPGSQGSASGRPHALPRGVHPAPGPRAAGVARDGGAAALWRARIVRACLPHILLRSRGQAASWCRL